MNDIKTEKSQNVAEQPNADSNPPEIKRLTLRVRSKLKGGALAMGPCSTISCHKC